MKKLLLAIAVLLLTVSVGYTQENNEWTPFNKIEREEGVIKLQFPNQGIRWLVSINEGPKQFSQYGDVVKLKIGDKLTLIDKHMTVVVKPEQKDRAYVLLVDYTADKRSLGGKIENKTYYIPIKDNESTQTQPLKLTIKSDKQVYEVGEEIKIEATIKNNSDKEMIVFWSHKKPVILTDEAGVYIVALHIQSPDDETLYIKPKENLKRDVVITLGEKMKPIKGRIGIQLEYNAQNVILNFKHTKDQEIFTGTLTSNTITIEVKEKKGITKEEALKIAANLIKLEQIDLAQYKLDSIGLVPRAEGPKFWVVVYSPVIRQHPGDRIIIRVNEKTGEAHRTGDE